MASKVKIDDQVWRNLKKRLGKGSPHVKVGVLAASGNHESGVSMIELAAIHEFGSPKAGIPERSFIRRAFRDNRRELRNITAKLARRLMPKGKGTSVRGELTVAQALEVLGKWGAALVQKTITAGPPIPPPLKLETAALKESFRPLVDTGGLVGSINHEVVT